MILLWQIFKGKSREFQGKTCVRWVKEKIILLSSEKKSQAVSIGAHQFEWLDKKNPAAIAGKYLELKLIDGLLAQLTPFFGVNDFTRTLDNRRIERVVVGSV